MSAIKLEDFNEHRPLLFGIAWRMLGNVADAEDILQEAFLRGQRPSGSVVRSPKAFLITIVTRLCLNHLDRAHVKMEQPCGMKFLSEKFASPNPNPAEDSDLAEALDTAFSVVLQSLSPTERAVFLLREVFDRDYDEVARIVEKSEANCRQILRRAREKLAGREKHFEVTLEQQEHVLHQFLVATETGKLDELARALTDDAILLSDGANLGSAPPLPIMGAKSVTQFFADRAESLFPPGKIIRKWSLFQKMPLFLGYRDGQLNYALAFSFREGFIQKLFLITCPVRLRFLSAQCSCAIEVALKTSPGNSQ